MTPRMRLVIGVAVVSILLWVGVTGWSLLQKKLLADQCGKDGGTLIGGGTKCALRIP